MSEFEDRKYRAIGKAIIFNARIETIRFLKEAGYSDGPISLIMNLPISTIVGLAKKEPYDGYGRFEKGVTMAEDEMDVVRKKTWLELVKKVIEYKTLGCDDVEISVTCDIPESTVRYIMTRYNELLDDYAKALADEFVFVKEDEE